MRRMLVAVLLISGIMSGCAHNHFNVPTDNFAEKTKVLGVVPIIMDADSDIRHPGKEQLIQIVTEMNRKYEQQFVRKVKASGNFYTVALMDGDPQRIFENLLYRREKRDDATIQYNKYFFKNEELRDYIKKNNLDAVMLIVVSGLTKTDKVYSSNLFASMTSDYNFLIMTAQILDSNSTILWEYPNFRSRILTFYPMINLQYPDFNEAEANLSSRTNLKFKTLDGIQRTLDQKRKDLLLRETQESDVYGKQFDEILELLKYDSDTRKKSSEPATGKPRTPGMQPQVAEDAAAGGAKQEVAPKFGPSNSTIQPVETLRTPAVGITKQPDDVIVPATGSTL
ncbi:MAG: hypothetical protein PHD54_13695 [Desulfuromonadaceae bacterium]|nr:hypothetical protein [Desulfuromonadaceae bacterium]